MTRMTLRGPVFRASTLVLSVLLVLLVAACDSPEEKEAKHLARGIEFAEAGDPSRAMVELQNALRLNPKNAEAYYQIGLIHERAERWVQAFNAFETATAEQPDHVAAWVKYGTLALMGGDLAAVEKAVEALAVVAPDDPDALTLDAALMAQRNDTERARQLARAVLADHPDHLGARQVLAGLLLSSGQPEAALAVIEDGLARLPNRVELLQVKLLLSEQLEMHDAMTDVLNQLIELEPQESLHRRNLARHLWQQGELAAAEATFEALIQAGLADPATVRELISLVYTTRGSAAAETRLEQLIAAEPTNYDNLQLLVNLFRGEGNLDRAEARLLKFVDELEQASGGQRDKNREITEALADAKAELAGLLLARDDVEGATAFADAAIALRATHPAGNVERGIIHLAAGETDEAIRRARNVLREATSYVPAVRLLAEAHLARSEADLGIQVLGDAYRLDPTDESVAIRLAQLLSERGDNDSALQLWNAMLETGRSPTTALAGRAAISIRQENWLFAQADIERLMAMPEAEVTGALLAARLSEARGRTNESLQFYARAAQLSPGSPEPIIGGVRALRAAGDIDAALQFIAQSMQNAADGALLAVLEAEMLQAAGRVDEAAATFREAIDTRPDWDNPYRQFAVLLLNQGDREAGLAVYQEGIATNPSSEQLRLEYARALLLLGEHQAAIEAYGTVLELDPVQLEAANNFGALVADHRYHDQEALDRALAVLRQVPQRDQPLITSNLGWLLFRKGDPLAALPLLERAALLAPDLAEVAYRLGAVRAAAGDVDGAMQSLDKALAEETDAAWIVDAQELRRQLRTPAPSTGN
jgi:cellulose synthase operon protein C